MTDLEEAIAYAIRNNGQEGLITSEETAAMLNRVAAGEITFDQLLKTVEFKARALGCGKKVTLVEAWEKVK